MDCICIQAYLDHLLAKLGSASAKERDFVRRARDLYTQALLETAGKPVEVNRSLEELRRAYANGEISEAEFDEAMDAIEEQEGLVGDEMLGYSIDENYERDIDTWDAQGRPDGEVFILGATGDVLQGLGAMEQDIYLRSEKVNTILQQHPEMTLTEIKRIPEILDDPVLVLKSRNAGRGGQQNTRLVLFGTVRAENGRPVLTVLDLRPVENGLAIDDMQKVTSSYTKDSNPVWYVQNSDILYADKNRTTPLLRTIGFQMPIELRRSGSMGSISYHRQNVKLEGVPFRDVVEEKQLFSFGGEKAALQGEGANDTMDKTRYSLKEDRENGGAREETRAAFLRRAAGDGLAVYEGETAAYGFRRVGDTSAGGYSGEVTQEARWTQRELETLGIPSDVIEGPVLCNRGGSTLTRDVSQAVTVDRSHIFISKDATISPRNIAGHEAFHLWRKGKGRDAYIEIVEDNLIYTGQSFIRFQATIAEAYLGEEADLSDNAQLDQLREEIFAYISGNIHEGVNDAEMRTMFYDYDAVKAAWDTLVRENAYHMLNLQRTSFTEKKTDAAISTNPSPGAARNTASVFDGTISQNTPGRKGGRKFSLPENEAQDNLPLNTKAEDQRNKVERRLVAKVGKLLNVPASAQRGPLRDIAREISTEMLNTGTVSRETTDRLFDRAWDEGVVVAREFAEENGELERYLRGTRFVIAPEDAVNNEQGSGHNREEAVPPLPNYFFFAFTFPRGLALAATRRASLSMWV